MPLKLSIIFPEGFTEHDWARIKSAAALKRKTVGEYVWRAVEEKLRKDGAPGKTKAGG